MYRIPFNKPHLTGLESGHLDALLRTGKLSGDGYYTKKCQTFFEEKYGYTKTFLTTSCTDALELASLAAGIQPGDEVIMPSFTFVSTANAFILRGAKIVFADSLPYQPNMDAGKIESLITPKTKAIVVMHYAGVACDMDQINALATAHGITVIEDAAQAIDSSYKGKPLGSLGDFGTFSFHDTKNIISGEGGLLTVNRKELIERTEIMRDKGTNRSAFFRAEVDKYQWVDKGSSFMPAELIAAFLYGQLECIADIQRKRVEIWNHYQYELEPMGKTNQLNLPVIEDFATNNGHMYYILCKSIEERTRLTAYLKTRGIQVAFQYQSLHKSPFYSNQHDGRQLIYADRYSDCLLRLPFYYDLEKEQVSEVAEAVYEYYKGAR